MKKKVFMSLLLLVMMFGFITPVFAKNIASCDSVLSSTVMIDQKIPEMVHTAVTAIKVVVPILLVIFGSLDLLKGVTAGKEDEIKKGQQIFIKRLIAGVLVFFVFTIVQLIVSFAAGDESQNISSCINCFINNNCEYK